MEPSAISYDDVTKVVSVQSLSAGRLAGPLDAASQTIYNPLISGGTLSQIGMYVIRIRSILLIKITQFGYPASVSTGSLEVTALKSSIAGQRLAFLDQRGRFVAQADPQVRFTRRVSHIVDAYSTFVHVCKLAVLMLSLSA